MLKIVFSKKNYSFSCFFEIKSLYSESSRRELSNRNENGKFVISSPDLSKTGIKVEKSLCEYFKVNSTLFNASISLFEKYNFF